jgi:integrase/recombinase XerD
MALRISLEGAMVIDQQIEPFLQYCAVERRLADNTVSAYRSDLADFRGWLGVAGIPNGTDTNTLKAYLQWMVAEQLLAAATVRRRIACLRAFFRRLAEHDLCSDPFAGWKLTLPPKRKRLPKALARAELKLLLERGLRVGCATRCATRIGVHLMIATGLRVGELCNVRVLDLAPDGVSLRVLGKGSRDRVVYISDQHFRTELTCLMQDRHRKDGAAAPLLVNRHGARLKPPSIRRTLHHAAVAAAWRAA